MQRDKLVATCCCQRNETSKERLKPRQSSFVPQLKLRLLMDPRRCKQPVIRSNKNEELEFFFYIEDSSTKLGFTAPPSIVQELHEKAVSIIPEISKAIEDGDMEAAFEILGKSPCYAVKFPLRTPKMSWCEKMVKMMNVDEDMTKLALGYSAGVGLITDPIQVDPSIQNRAIRDIILCGDIGLAFTIVEKYHPMLVHDSRFVSLVPYFLTYQLLIELTRRGKVSSARWILEQSLKLITKSHPWLDDEVNKLKDLIVSFLNPGGTRNKELLDLSQRQKTANAVIGAILLIDYHQGPTLNSWLKCLADERPKYRSYQPESKTTHIC